MPYFNKPLTLRGVVWIAASTHDTTPVEGHVEFTMRFPDRDHCTLCYSREDTPERILVMHEEQMEATREVARMLLGPRAPGVLQDEPPAP